MKTRDIFSDILRVVVVVDQAHHLARLRVIGRSCCNRIPSNKRATISQQQGPAQLLVEQGHRVVLHARNAKLTKDALAGVPGAEAAVMGDLTSISEIRFGRTAGQSLILSVQ